MKFLIIFFLLAYIQQIYSRTKPINKITITHYNIQVPFYSNQTLLAVEDNEKIIWDSNNNTYFYISMLPYKEDINYTIKSNYQIISNLEGIKSSLNQLVFIGYSPEDENLQYTKSDFINAFYINTNTYQIYRANIYKITDDGFDLFDGYVENTTNHLPVFPVYKYKYSNGTISSKTLLINKVVFFLEIQLALLEDYFLVNLNLILK